MTARKKYQIASYIVDLLICLLVTTILAVLLLPKSIFTYIFVPGDSSISPYNMFRILELGIFAEIFLGIYLILIPSRSNGQTLGMKIFKIKLVSANDKNCTVGQYFTFGLICDVLMIIVTFGLYIIVDFAVLLYRNDNMSLTNIISGTKFIDKLDY